MSAFEGHEQRGLTAVVSGVSRWRKYAMQFADADYERIRDRRRFALSSR
jgi:hypothetical protein